MSISDEHAFRINRIPWRALSGITEQNILKPPLFQNRVLWKRPAVCALGIGTELKIWKTKWQQILFCGEIFYKPLLELNRRECECCALSQVALRVCSLQRPEVRQQPLPPLEKTTRKYYVTFILETHELNGCCQGKMIFVVVFVIREFMMEVRSWLWSQIKTIRLFCGLSVLTRGPMPTLSFTHWNLYHNTFF